MPLLGVAVFAVTLSRISKNFLPSIKSFCKSLASKVIIKRAVIHEIKSEELLTVIAKSKPLEFVLYIFGGIFQNSVLQIIFR